MDKCPNCKTWWSNCPCCATSFCPSCGMELDDAEDVDENEED